MLWIILQNITTLLTTTKTKCTRRATTNFSRQGRFRASINISSKIQEKRPRRETFWNFFSWILLRWTQSGHFFPPKSGQFFRFLKKGRRGFSPPPLVASLCTNKKIDCTLIFFQESKISFILDHLSVYISYKVKMSFLKESIKDSFRWL